MGFPCGSFPSACNAGDLGWEDPLEKEMATHSSILAWRIPQPVKSMGSQRVRHNLATFTFSFWASLVVELVKNLPAMQETWVQSLGWEDPLEEAVATQSSILAWRIPMDRGTWRATVRGIAKSWTRLSD